MSLVMKILVPLDGSSNGALAPTLLAARLPKVDDAVLVELVHVQPQLPPLARRALGREAASRYHGRVSLEVLEPAVSVLEEAGAVVRCRTEFGVPAVRIAARAETIAADLVVMGSHGHSALTQLFLGSVTQGVLARTSRPVLVLRATRRKPTVADGPLYAGVAVDGSKASRAALQALLDLRHALGGIASITLIHAEEPAQVFLDSISGAALPSTPGADRATTLRLLGAFRRRVARAGIECRETILTGWPDDVIPPYVSKHLDLLALGATGRSKLSRAMLGSVAARLATTSNVPLLFAHAPGSTLNSASSS